MISTGRSTGSATAMPARRDASRRARSHGPGVRRRARALLLRQAEREIRQLAVAALLPLLISIAADAQPLDARLPTCFACHGEHGQSQLPEVPSLGAQPALYSLIQLVMFRDRLRVSDPM